MKKIILSLIIIVLIGCKAQNVNAPAVVDNDGNLIGVVTKSSFLVEPYSNWFLQNYNAYKVNEVTIESLKPLLKNISIKAFMGTWCGDSKQQTPVFYKVLDAADFNYKNLELVAVNRAKKTPNNLQEGLDIIRVPTFIFYRNGKEIGRIVEYPRESIEADMLKIVSNQPYKHSYED